MTKLDEIRATNEARKVHDTGDRDYANGKRDDDYDREHLEFFLSAGADIDMLLAILDERTEALARIGRMNSCVEFDCGVAIHAAARIARGALAEDGDGRGGGGVMLRILATKNGVDYPLEVSSFGDLVTYPATLENVTDASCVTELLTDEFVLRRDPLFTPESD